MKQEAKLVQQIQEKFHALLEATSVSEYEDRKDHLLMGRSYGRNNAFLTWPQQPYQEAIEAVKQMNLKASENTIGKALSASIVKLFEQKFVRGDANPEAEARWDSILPILDDSAIREEVGELLDFLSSLVKTHTVFVPIYGVKLEGLSKLPIGGVTLLPVGSGPVATLLSKPEVPKPIRDFASIGFKGVECYAMVEAEGESGFAKEQAFPEVENVIHILNVLLASSHRRFRGWKKIRAGGQELSSEFAIAADSPIEGVDADSTTWGLTKANPHVRSYEISPEKVELWRELGLDNVIQCFSSDYSPGEIESKIRQAVTWYSRGMSANGTEERFVAVTIALESMLVGKGEGGGDPKVSWGSIGQRLADRVAFLIGRDPEERIRLAERTKHLYGLRSKIVHEGTTVSLKKLYLLEEVFDASFRAFVALAGGDVKSWPDFQKWEKQRKYSVQEQTDEQDSSA